MQDTVAGIVTMCLILTLQNVYALTKALYFGGKWNDVILWGGCVTAIVLTCATLWLTTWWRGTAKTIPTPAPEAARPPSPTKETPVFGLLALFLLGCSVDLWFQISNAWSAPIVPLVYQFGLRVCGVIVVAGATWLVLRALQTLMQGQKAG